jgi:putative transposase
MAILQSIFFFLRAFLLGRAAAALENLARRQQVAALEQFVKRPKLRPCDRVFWILLSRLWKNWRSALAIVQPETVIRWYRKGFRVYWQ